MTDRLAQIEARKVVGGRTLLTEEERDALVEIAKAARELEAAISETLGTMAFYFGPNARTAVSRESSDSFTRVRFARDMTRAALSVLDDREET